MSSVSHTDIALYTSSLKAQDMDETTVSMHGMAIWDTGEVLFSPPPAILNRLPYKGQVDDRYLYRIYDQNSHGYTSDRIAFSRDIDQGTPECLIDVFARENRQAAADMLFRHLEFTSRDDTRTDNFVSWTSSLLFALKYAFYRAKINASSVEDIRLCIIDTTKFVKGSFMRDWDLMTAFSSADPRLQGFRKLRERKHKHYAGVYYFGEYLSQGRLSLRNKCSVVALSDMIKAKLPTLLPDLFLTDVNRKLLINSVIALREGWNSNSKNDGGPGWVTEKEVTAAVSIGKLFGLRFKMPVALSLLALQPRREADDMIMECFTGLDFRAFEMEQLAPAETKIADCDYLPEVTQFAKLAKAVYTKHCFDQAKSDARDVRERLESFSSAVKALRRPSSWKSDLLYADEDELVAEMADIQTLADQLFEMQ